MKRVILPSTFISVSYTHLGDIASQLGNKIEHALRAYTPQNARP